jgi:cation:H+ antiporter
VDDFIRSIFEGLSSFWLIVISAAALYALGVFADILVDQAVILSERSGIPKVIVGATIVSLGTTAPEVAVSVFAAFNGKSELAMGNAVGSIICDTGLILGIACLIAPLQIPRAIASRQGWVQLGCAVLLVLLSIPWAAPLRPFTDGASGNFSQISGFFFLALLVLYLWASVKWAKLAGSTSHGEDKNKSNETESANVTLIVLKLIGGIIGVVLSANIVIPGVSILAERIGIPTSIIAGTVVAFGTSLPELTTAIKAARRGHGDLAVGNIIGADILNALFVAGAAAAVTSDGLDVTPVFFQIMFPAMLFVLIVFRIGIFTSKEHLSKGFGFVLIGTYLVYLVVSFAIIELEKQDEQDKMNRPAVQATQPKVDSA